MLDKIEKGVSDEDYRRCERRIIGRHYDNTGCGSHWGYKLPDGRIKCVKCSYIEGKKVTISQ